MTIDFSKHPDGLVPAIVQDVNTKCVLMLGYMNHEAITKTKETRQVTFFSRSKSRIWTKGEESGHVLTLVDMAVDCDRDAILIQAKPKGPTCHKGDDTCWGGSNTSTYGFLTTLEKVIRERKNNPSDKSYVAGLFAKGINKIAQKVGEEAVETVIEAKDTNSDLFLNESADLLFHLMILIQAKGHTFDDVVSVLGERQSL